MNKEFPKEIYVSSLLTDKSDIMDVPFGIYTCTETEHQDIQKYIRADIVHYIELDRDYTTDCANIILDEYEAYKEKHKWHKYPECQIVEDRSYLLNLKDGTVTMGYFSGEKVYLENGGVFDLTDVIAWMELPEPLKED